MEKINFDNLTKLEKDDFEIVDIYDTRSGPTNEPHDGLILYKGQNYYFTFSHEFDCGNTYLVYDNRNVSYHFALYVDIDGEDDAPMLKYEK
jgi:hypothetical protein